MQRLRQIAALFSGPLFALLYPLLGLWSNNDGEIPLRDLGRPFLLGLVLLLALWGLFWLFTRRNGERAAALTTLSLLLFFSFDLIETYLVVGIQDFLVTLAPHQSLLLQQRWLGITVWLVLTLGLGLLLHRLARHASPLSGLTLFTGILVGWLIPGTVRALQRQKPPTSPPVLSASSLLGATSALPDLYCIVLDGYGRQDVLKRLYGLDNEPFLRALEARGFFIARKSRANYIQTPLALASALNLSYITPPPVQKSHDTEPSRLALEENRIRTLLAPRGFQFISVPTGVNQIRTLTADKTLEQPLEGAALLTGIERMLLERTPLGFLLAYEGVAFREHRSRLLSALEVSLPAAAALPQPKFVFAHILAPHPPFVFGPQGQDRVPSTGAFSIGDATDYTRRGSQRSYRQGYSDQLIFLNKKVLEAVDAVQKNAKRPAVIVLMGDHGPRMNTDWKSLAKTDTNEVFYNLMAVSAPDGKAGELIGDLVSPINVFRLLLTRYFGQELPRLPERSFYSTLEKPYSFDEVKT